MTTMNTSPCPHCGAVDWRFEATRRICRPCNTRRTRARQLAPRPPWARENIIVEPRSRQDGGA